MRGSAQVRSRGVVLCGGDRIFGPVPAKSEWQRAGVGATAAKRCVLLEVADDSYNLGLAGGRPQGRLLLTGATNSNHTCSVVPTDPAHPTTDGLQAAAAGIPPRKCTATATQRSVCVGVPLRRAVHWPRASRLPIPCPSQPRISSARNTPAQASRRRRPTVASADPSRC